MLRRDIHNISKENPFAIHPRDIKRTTSEAELKDITLSAKSPQQASRELIQAANAAGGPDNITVIIIQIPEYPEL